MSEDRRPRRTGAAECLSGSSGGTGTERTPAVSDVDLSSHALAYARAGLDVLPLTPGGKTPLGALVPHGKDDATADLDRVRSWWVQQPSANIGVRPHVGVVVLDVDPRNSGASALVDLSRPHGGLLSTWTCWTGGGGLHAWFLVTGGHRAQLCPGVDLKGHTGYLVVPPSLHPSGRRYSWSNALPVAKAPRWLADLVRKPRAVQLPQTSGVVSISSVDALVRTVEAAKPGSRNDVTYWAARRAAERGAPAGVFDRIRAAAVSLGITTAEADRTIGSARTTTVVPA